MKITVLGLAFLVMLAASGRADTNDLSFEIHFDPQKTKLENGTNYFGIDYLLINNSPRPLGVGAGKINIYAIDSSGHKNQIFPQQDDRHGWVTLKSPQLLQKGESWKGVAWVPTIEFGDAKRESKLVAEKNLFYNSNKEPNKHRLFFVVYSAAIPLGKIDIKKRVNDSTNDVP